MIFQDVGFFFRGSARRRVFAAALCLAVLAWGGCKGKPPEAGPILAQVGQTTLTLVEFDSLFSLVEAGLGASDVDDNSGRRKVREAFLQQLLEEMTVTEYGRTLGVALEPGQLEKAEREIWKDYAFVNPETDLQTGETTGDQAGGRGPDENLSALDGPPESFRQIFVEQALSYDVWRTGLARRLLVREVIRREVLDKIAVTEEEIGAYLKDNPPEGAPPAADDGELEPGEDGASGGDVPPASAPEAAQIDLRERARAALISQKAESDYIQFLDDLRERFPVAVHPELL